MEFTGEDLSTLDFIKGVSAQINDEFKVDVAVAGTNENLSDCKIRVPTTSHILNLLMGGGVPLGRVVEIFGEPSHGKSTLEQHMMNGFQQYPGISILLDAESSWDRNRAIRMGHNPARHIHLQADTVELGFSVIDSTIKKVRMPGSKFPKNMPIGIFWDTISASQTEGEKTGDQYKNGMMDKARLIRRWLRTLSLFLPSMNCSLVFLNQTIEGPNNKGKQTTGGGAIKFWASKRYSVYKTGDWDYPDKKCGILTNVRNVKDKMDPPFREVELPINNKFGIDPLQELIHFLAANSKFVNISGGRVRIPDYPEVGREVTAYHKHIHEKVNDYPDLVDYLKICAESTWNDLYGV